MKDMLVKRDVPIDIAVVQPGHGGGVPLIAPSVLSILEFKLTEITSVERVAKSTHEGEV